MTDFLYITADVIGAATGGGSVTKNESEVLASLGETEVWSLPGATTPWAPDQEALRRLRERPDLKPKLAHFYAGTFSMTIALLKERGCKVTYTAAAHVIAISRAEHEKLGWPFDYPHLTDKAQWASYVRGYLLADVVVCPSTLSENVMRGHGVGQPVAGSHGFNLGKIVVIPHGVEIPPVVMPPPVAFSVATLGQPGADKGLIYMLKAWAQLNYRDALFTIAGRGTEQLLGMVRQHGGGNIQLLGAVEHVSSVYNACRVFVQPSASEGFGIEVLEAMAHGRPVICSDGAGGRDVAKTVVPGRNVQALAAAIDAYRMEPWRSAADGEAAREEAKKYTWPIIKAKYVELWRGML